MDYCNEHGQLHRTDEPTVIRADGTQEWCQNGKRHRVDAPAIEYANGSQEWWVNGREITQFEHWVLTGAKGQV